MSVLEALLTSKVRAALLSRLTAGDDDIGSVSQLAREFSVTPRAVVREAERLEQLGLLLRLRVGREDRLVPNENSLLLPILARLVAAAAKNSEMSEQNAQEIRRNLASYGAPLAGVEPNESPRPLVESIILGLKLAKSDSTLLRVLPVVMHLNRDVLDLDQLLTMASRHKMGAELGMLLEVTSKLVDWPELEALLPRLRDGRRTKQRFFFEPRSKLEAQAMKGNTPSFAKKWGFWLNMDESTFRSTLALHNAHLHG